jgi:hypothetical protein
VKYYVQWPNGQRFGPADLPTLQQWAAENRIDRNTILISESTGMTLTAAEAMPMVFPPTPGAPFASPPSQAHPGSFTSGVTPPVFNQQGYYRPHGAMGVRGAGDGEVVGAWVLAALACPCFCAGPIGLVMNLVGIALAQSASRRGNRNGQAAMIANALELVINGILTFVLGGAGLLSLLGG